MTAWRCLRHDDGSTLTEAMIALGVVWFALVGLMTTMLVASTDVGLGRQRQAATGIANELMERVRGLSIVELGKGLSSSDPAFVGPAADQNIRPCGSSHYFRACPTEGGEPEKIVSTPGLPPLYPLVPHRAPVEAKEGTPTTFTRYVYVTEASDVPGGFRVTVVVTWTSLRGGTTSRVQSETLVYAPVGCVDPSTHPFPAPCSPYFYAPGVAQPAVAEVTGTLDGEEFRSRLASPSVRAALQVEQLGRGQASVVAGGASVAKLPADPAESGVTKAVSVDDDPATSVPTHDAETLVPDIPPGSSITSALGNGWRANSEKVGESSNGDNGTAVAAMTAGTQEPPCPAVPALPETDELPCAYAHVSPATRQIMRLDIKLPDASTDVVRIARVESTPAWLYAKRRQHVGGEGQSTLDGERGFQQVRLLGLPSSVTKPTKWASANYLVQLSNYTSEVASSAGTGLSSSPHAAQSGTLSFWNGDDYEELTDWTTPQTIEFNVTAEGLVAEGRVTVTIQGSITSGGTVTEVVPDPTKPEVRTSAEAIVNPAIFGELEYKVQLDGAPHPLVHFTMNVDLGSLISRTSYKEADVA